MRNLIFVLSTIAFTSCFMQKHRSVDEDGKYGCIRLKIIGIDSTGRNYIIHAQHKNDILKIVSSKQEVVCADNKIVVGRKYTLNLESIFGRKFGSIRLTDGPERDFYINRAFYNGEDIYVDDSCIQCKRDVFKSNNLSGLCFIK